MTVPRLRLDARQRARLSALRASRTADHRPRVDTNPTAWSARSCKGSAIVADDLAPCRSVPVHRVTRTGHGWEASDFYCPQHLPGIYRDALTTSAIR